MLQNVLAPQGKRTEPRGSTDCSPLPYVAATASWKSGLCVAMYLYVCVCVCARARVLALSCGLLFVTPWTVACQAPLSMGFSRQECWSGLPFPSPGDLPNSVIEPGSPALQADSLPSEPPGKPSHMSNALQLYVLEP